MYHQIDEGRECDYKQVGAAICGISFFLSVLAGFLGFIYFLTTRSPEDPMGAEQGLNLTRSDSSDLILSGANDTGEAERLSDGLQELA